MQRLGDINKQPIISDEFDQKYLGGKKYELTLKPPFYVVQTGSAVITNFRIQMPHRLIRVEAKHTNSSNADSSNALTWSLTRAIANNLFQKLINYANVATIDFLEEFGEGYEFPDMEYQLITNTTSTDRFYLKITLQLLE